ncbi:MAG TPA: amino acid permease [Steroidobacteraceae bacterium]|nr:amino acid permease [Steroidobacteraceae bacterium]
MNTQAAAASADEHSLSRTLRPRHISMITIGGIIGAGLFVGSSVAIAAAGPACIISYALTGAVVFLIMRMLGEMAVANPEVRSFTEFARVGLGHWAGFSVGWLYWFFWVVVIPVEAIAGATILQRWLPLENWQIGLLLMAAMTMVNLMSARAYGEFEFWFSSIKVSAIIVFILMAASYAFGLMGSQGPTFATLTAHGGFAPQGGLAVLATVTTVIFSMMGAEIVAVAAAESAEPARAVARMSSTIIVRILVFYIASILMIVSIVPWTAVKPGQSPFTLALETMHIGWAPTIMSAIILTAVLSCLNSAFYVASRVLFVLAEKGDAPRWLVKTNARHVPARAVLLGSVFGFAGVITAILSPSGVYAFLQNASGAVIVFVYIGIAAAQIRLRIKNQRAGLPPPQLPIWLFPWLSYFAIAAMTAVLVAMAFTPDLASQLWASVLSVVVALAAYALLRHGKYGTPP